MNTTRQEQGHRWFAALYDRINAGSERRLGPRVRAPLLQDLRGRVLEVGAGTGANFGYYPPEATVVATDPDPFMLERAKNKLAQVGATNIQLRQANTEQLPFEDRSFDHVVSTLVFCSVPDVARGLGEIRRVLKLEGTFRFFEHIRNDESAFWGRAHDVLTPAWRWLGAGCHLNRRTQQAIEGTGFRIERMDRVGVGPGTWAIYGVARSG